MRVAAITLVALVVVAVIDDDDGIDDDDDDDGGSGGTTGIAIEKEAGYNPPGLVFIVLG